MRTWTLKNEEWMFDGIDGPEIEGPPLTSAPVEVIELEPVLDLLEDLMPGYEREAWSPTDFRIEALLIAHNRLLPSGD